MLYKLLENGSFILAKDASDCTLGKKILLTSFQDPETKNLITISSVFLGMDHNFMLHGPPILFETMVFNSNEETCYRASSLEDIKQIHYQVCIDYYYKDYQYVSGDNLPESFFVKDATNIDLF